MKIRAYLLITVGAILLPISLFAAVALQTLLRAEREAALQALTETVSATALLVDRELSSAEAALRVLARSPHLASGDIRAFYDHARSADRGEGGRTILFDAEGQQIINTVAPYGQPLRPAPDYVRVRTRRVIESQQTVVSDLIIGALQQIPVTTINIPVPLDGGRRYVLGSVFAPDYFSKLIARRAMPSSWTLSVIDRAGRYVARSREPTRLGNYANPALLDAANAHGEGQVRYNNRADIDSYHAYARSPMSGWIVAVSVPAAEIEGAARRATTLAAAGLLVALLCASAAAAFFGRRLLRAVAGAEATAAMLGRGEQPRRPGTGIAEVDALQDAMCAAGRKLAEADRQRAELLARERDARCLAEEQVRIRDDFLAMLSHELRNPLSGIVGAAQLLGMESPNAALKRNAQDILMRQSRHLTRIVDDLLDLARLARGKIKLEMQPVELSAVVESTVSALRVAGRVDHALGCRLQRLWVRGDRTRIEQVVGNLVTNALKYTPPGGRIDIVLEANEGMACLEVADTGVGIAPELMPKLFDIFVQGTVSLDRAQGGLGIGLALVQRLAALHGGSIEAASAGSGEGSTFRLRLPLLAALPHETPPTGEARSAPAAHPFSTVLLVDDNDDARRMLVGQFEAAGWRVSEAADGIAGLALARRARPDLAVVDIGLPGIDGYQVARALRADASFDGMRLVALTGYGQEADRLRALDAGFDAHYVKPIDFEALVHDLAAT
ncbi:hybrid sensor histidine kinase/response regulator [Massilia sp. TN1-12]|uniref:hybrid sensor histidine kinase/response regulator n=1 Tax=Massilia paldalensis TaxID=3377675 RepID=UPI00384B5413